MVSSPSRCTSSTESQRGGKTQSTHRLNTSKSKLKKKMKTMKTPTKAKKKRDVGRKKNRNPKNFLKGKVTEGEGANPLKNESWSGS